MFTNLSVFLITLRTLYIPYENYSNNKTKNNTNEILLVKTVLNNKMIKLYLKSYVTQTI